jgi:hypothetical protein
MYRVYFKRGAPQKEIDDIIRLLKASRIKFYESPDEIFGQSTASIWVRDLSEYNRARRIINKYQKKNIRTDQHSEGVRALKWITIATVVAFSMLSLILAINR